MPFFSVVIPVFNRADLLGATVDSVIAQSYGAWELIVIDDGSTDGSLAIAQSYQARLGAQMQVLQQSHAGPGAARNRGTEAAQGTYIAFLDSDDLWFSWTLELYARVLHEHDFPAFMTGEPLVFSDAHSWQNAPQRSHDEALRAAHAEGFADYLRAEMPTDWLSVSSFVVRRDALHGKRFCPLPINAEDIDFTLQMCVEPGFVNLARPATFGYRQHAGGITSRYGRTVAGIHLLIESERAGRYPGGPKRRRERLTLLSRHLRPALLEFLDQGYRRAAWRAFMRTFSWHLELGRARFLLGFTLRSLRPLRRHTTRVRGSAGSNTRW